VAALTLVAFTVAGAAWRYYFYTPAEPATSRRTAAALPDPRLSYTGPYRNVHLDVPYVGDDKCFGCHREISASYRRHPMGRSLTPITAAADEAPADRAHHNPFRAFGLSLEVVHNGAEVGHRVHLPAAGAGDAIGLEFPVAYAVGSGARGRSYICEHDGYLLQTPISYFTQKAIWDLSPGFHEGLLAGRPVVPECLHCHANRVHFYPGSFNRYERPAFTGHAIGCERCHGPGALHVQSGDTLDVVNPKNLTPDLRDAVCEQCHLEGEVRVLRRGRDLYDYRPGLPMHEFWTVFVSNTDGEGKAVTHFEEMRQSRCYQGSQGPGRLGCVSCHDPHVQVGAAERIDYYRRRCLECHREHPCSLPLAKRRGQAGDSCIDCHMPRFGTADIAHAAATDHRVPRRPAPMRPGAPGRAVRRGVAFYHHPRPDPADPDLGRDLGVALVHMAQQASNKAELAASAVPLLEVALQHDPDDVPAWEAKGLALLQSGKHAAALAAMQAALAHQPDREACVTGAARAAQDSGNTELTIHYWRQAIALNPWMPSYRRDLTRVLLHLGQFDEAGREVQEWLRCAPFNMEAYRCQVEGLLRAGKKNEARAVFAIMEALRPADVKELRAWYTAQSR
jgi:Flp pilus assembly protein TadD